MQDLEVLHRHLIYGTVTVLPITNAKRLAVGLAPNPPVRRDAMHVYGM